YRTDPGNADTDMDGLSDGEEISASSLPVGRDSDGDGLVDGSDPDPAVSTPLSDLDGDGIPDAYENHWFGGTNAVDSMTDRDETGFTLLEKISAGINPTNAPSEVHVGNANSLVSWRLFDGFTLACQQGATNVIWERTFNVNRSSAWQQFFISSSKDSAAHWNLKGMTLEWETNEGAAGSVSSSPMGDSFRIPLATNECPAAITLRLRSKGAAVLQMPEPLFFIAYAPVFKIEGGEAIEGKSGKRFSLFKGGVGSSISLTVDHSLRPCNAPLGDDEKDVASLYAISEMNEEFEFSGDDSGGKITPKRPGTCDLPDFTVGGLPTQQTFNARAKGSRSGGSETTIIVIDPSSGWRCEGHGYGYDGMGYDWADDYYYEEDSYPLDSSCLRRSWSRGYEGGWNHEYCEVWVSSGMGGDYGYVTSSVEGETGKLFVDGIEVWSSTPEHTYGGDEGSFGGSSEYELEDGCNSCETDCANGNCDSLEGSSLGSLKFRIPLGSPVKGQVSGFVWIAADEPIHIYKEMFNVISHPDASIEETDAGGVRRIVSHDSRGRDVRIEDTSSGVRIAIYETLSQKLEHTWEILNVDGNSEQVRLRKISRLDNVMSDETYTYRFGDWVKFDNIAQIETELNISDDFTEYGDGVKRETRTTRDASGNILQSVTTWQTRIGDFDNAVMREIRREESTGRDWKCTEADYWNDPSHSGRHGQLRLVSGNARAWVYTDFDEQGHETLRIEQRGNAETPADFPYVVSNVLYNASALENAFVTVKDYAPFTLDDCHKDDAAKPRQETRYVVVNGTPTVIGRTWTCYTRLTRNGYAAIRKETWRASAPDAQLNDLSNAYSYEITYAETGVGTPLLMRGAVAESMDENGVLTENTYSLSDSILAQVSRKSFDGTFNQTYTVTEKDATYGTVLCRRECLSADDTVVAEEVSSYDEKNRLRSTTYFDGTFITNAYSCCRLLWRQDREGRKVLRSAKTGTDHLYNAEEDVWLAELGNGERGTGTGFRVTQHFFDAIGRETNTVVYAGSAPGEAVEASASDGKVHSCETTEYPYGGDDYAVHTDE
ncbi:MAG: hypothetical protein IKK82_02370, partial [Kiritimatiellae bacterium]|nr:hypothetical protein [Kiritimatiellia bacterium]